MQIKRLLFEISCHNILGENVIWHHQEQALYWTDIEGKLLYKCALSARGCEMLSSEGIDANSIKAKSDYLQEVLKVFDLPYRLGSFAFTNKNHILIAGFENGLAFYDYTNAKVEWLSQKEVSLPHLRYNDGKCDPCGRYWIGSMVENAEIKKLAPNEQASLYSFYFEQGKLHTKHALGTIHISNGLCFSDNGRVMYHSDSSSQKVYQYQLAANGDIESRKLFAKFDKNIYPDGACTDLNGNVWLALWGGACIVCIDKKGNELFRHPLPVTQGTCVCIGGPKMNWLFVTSASQGLSPERVNKQRRAGNLFVYEISDSVGITEPHVVIA